MTPDHSYQYDFVITGASGNIGRHLIPRLSNRGYKILAVGRDIQKTRVRYSSVTNVDIADYDDLTVLPSCNTLIHLAARNNNQPGLLPEFIQDNVRFAEKISEEFSRMKGKRFINVSSIHSLDRKKLTPYSVSKDMASRRIEQLIGDRLDDVRIGYFYDKKYFGERLKVLKNLGPFAPVIFEIFKALKPTTSGDDLENYVAAPVNAQLVPGILTDDLTESLTYRSVTRMLDIAVSVGILIFLLPLFIVLWAFIRLDSSGPVIFAQQRVGKGQAIFTLYKFRTMKRDTTAAATHEVSASSVTRVGKFLRRTKLDELPQAINLLRGDMTLVGPRPCLPVQTELLNAREALGIYTMKPGVTGYSQVREIDMSRPQELANSDHIYLKLQSLALNLKIILLTAFGRGGGDRVALPGDP